MSEGSNRQDVQSLLTESFHHYFSVALALTPEQKQAAFRIRYRVYCEEFRYEPTDRFPDQLETDEYDAHALNCLIIHRRSGMPAGCVRVVPALGSEHEWPLPFEKHIAESLDQAYIRNLHLPRETICEVSRLAVDGAFRRRAGEQATRFGEVDAMDLSHPEKRTFGLIAVAAFLAATAVTDLSGRTNVFAVMEPFLPRLLKRSGILFHKVGEDVEYHGLRAPYFGQTRTTIAEMIPELKDFYLSIYDAIADTYNREIIS